jgi:hypothetical protein
MREVFNLECPIANVSFVSPATRATERLVLKVQWPHEECMYEAEALRVLNGIGAIRLLAHDPARHALCANGACRARIGDWRKVKTMPWREANRERWRLFETPGR